MADAWQKGFVHVLLQGKMKELRQLSKKAAT